MVSVNNTKLTAKNASEVLGKSMAWTVGDPLQVTIKRNGREIPIKTTLSQSYTQALSFDTLDTASEAENALRQAWLKK